VLDVLTAADARHWALLTRAALAARVPRSTPSTSSPCPTATPGTNLYLTFDAAIDEVVAVHEGAGILGTASLVRECHTLKRAILLSARGNSGVIVSQLNGAGLAGALASADRLAWRAVTEPKEGTILSVSRAVSDRLRDAVDRDPTVPLAEVITLAVDTGTDALERTPSQLPALARAGVVDAGGAGYLLLIEALARVIHGQPPQADDDPMRRHLGWSRPVLPARAHAESSGDDGGEGPAYEVMYLLTDSDEERVAALRTRLSALGDSLLVVGAEGTWNVHVHVDDPGAAIEAGIEAGRPHRIVVTHFGDQIKHALDPSALAVVACAAGEGIAEVFRAAGASVVLSGPGRRASAGQILEAIRTSGAGQVLVLPNDGDTELAAQAAARAAAEEGQSVQVVRSRTAVQGIAALAVFDHGTDLAANAQAMADAAAATRHGAVTIARKEALTAAGVCHVGDVLGVVQGEFAIIGSDLYDVAGQVVQALVGDDGELLTVISGDDAPADLASAVVAAARIRRRDLEVTHIHGMQPLYPLLLGVE
jgi:DAK2 domain fusion protein YloV